VFEEEESGKKRYHRRGAEITEIGKRESLFDLLDLPDLPDLLDLLDFLDFPQLFFHSKMGDSDFGELVSDGMVAELPVEGDGGVAGVEGHHPMTMRAGDSFRFPDKLPADSGALKIGRDSDLAHLYLALLLWRQHQTGDKCIIAIACEMKIIPLGCELLGRKHHPKWAPQDLVAERNRLVIFRGFVFDDLEAKHDIDR
jgi:hypothetical protein